MTVRTFVLTVLAVLCYTTVGTSAQHPPQGADAARNAFPVPATVRVVHDVVYADYGARRLKLDVYLPPASGQRGTVPGVVVVRGNGWRSGDKEGFGFIAGQLAREGFVAASIEYRTSAEAKFPAAVHDVKAAVRWIRANAGTYSSRQINGHVEVETGGGCRVD